MDTVMTKLNGGKREYVDMVDDGGCNDDEEVDGGDGEKQLVVKVCSSISLLISLSSFISSLSNIL